MLRNQRTRLSVTPLAKTLCVQIIHRDKRFVGTRRRGPNQLLLKSSKSSCARTQMPATLAYAQAKVDAAGGDKVPLPRIGYTLRHMQRLHDIGNQEVKVCVTLCVHMRRLVERNTVESVLHVLAML